MYLFLLYIYHLYHLGHLIYIYIYRKEKEHMNTIGGEFFKNRGRSGTGGPDVIGEKIKKLTSRIMDVFPGARVISVRRLTGDQLSGSGAKWPEGFGF